MNESRESRRAFFGRLIGRRPEQPARPEPMAPAPVEPAVPLPSPPPTAVPGVLPAGEVFSLEAFYAARAAAREGQEG